MRTVIWSAARFGQPSAPLRGRRSWPLVFQCASMLAVGAFARLMLVRRHGYVSPGLRMATKDWRFAGRTFIGSAAFRHCALWKTFSSVNESPDPAESSYCLRRFTYRRDAGEKWG